MDKDGLIYELDEEQKAYLNNLQNNTPTISVIEKTMLPLLEDVARLDGYLKGRADSDRSKRGGKGNNKDLAG